MATKSKLEEAVERQAASLDDAQRELVLSQFATYKWNKARMKQLEDQLKLLDSKPMSDASEVKVVLAYRKSLTAERNQLTTANNSISSKLFMQLKGTGGDADEFDEFLRRNNGQD